MTYNNPLLEGQAVEMSLSFNHLYGDKWAALYGEANPFRTRRIIFPQFTPMEGEEYQVRVSVTKTGVFIYKGETFRVCRAELSAAATQGGVILYQIFGEQPDTILGNALQSAGIGTKQNTTMADRLVAAGFGRKK